MRTADRPGRRTPTALPGGWGTSSAAPTVQGPGDGVRCVPAPPVARVTQPPRPVQSRLGEGGACAPSLLGSPPPSLRNPRRWSCPRPLPRWSRPTQRPRCGPVISVKTPPQTACGLGEQLLGGDACETGFSPPVNLQLRLTPRKTCDPIGHWCLPRVRAVTAPSTRGSRTCSEPLEGRPGLWVPPTGKTPCLGLRCLKRPVLVPDYSDLADAPARAA